MPSAEKVALATEDAVGADHATLPQVIDRLALIDHGRTGAHTAITRSDLTNRDGATVTAGMVVVQDTGNAGSFTRTTTQSSLRPVFVVAESITNTDTGRVAYAGYHTAVLVQGNVAIGDYLRTSPTLGRAESAGVAPARGAFARATSAYAGGGAGTVSAQLFGVTLAQPEYQPASLTNRKGSSTAVGDVLVVSAANASSAILGDTVSTFQKVVVAQAIIADAAAGEFALSGIVSAKANGPIALGQYVRKSATTLCIEDAGTAVGTTTAAPSGACGLALAAASGGFCTILLFPETQSISSSLPRSYLAGFAMANDATDPTNDWSFGPGACRDSGNTADIVNASTLVKQLDAVWAVGNNAGMRASGAAIANTTYFLFVIKRPDTGVVDFAADTSASGANIAANTDAAYTLKRRIGWLIRSGGAILAVKWDGDYCEYDVPQDDYSATNPGTGTVTPTLTFVPVGITGHVVMGVGFKNDSSTGSNALLMFGGNVTGAGATYLSLQTISLRSGTDDGTGAQVSARFNTSGQIKFDLSQSDAGTQVHITTMAVIDQRGSDD